MVSPNIILREIIRVNDSSLKLSAFSSKTVFSHFLLNLKSRTSFSTQNLKDHCLSIKFPANHFFCSIWLINGNYSVASLSNYLPCNKNNSKLSSLIKVISLILKGIPWIRRRGTQQPFQNFYCVVTRERENRKMSSHIVMRKK